MHEPNPGLPNEAQAKLWNGGAGKRWVINQQLTDHAFQALGQSALERLGPVPGERVLDLGCGAGTSTLEIASLVGGRGSAVGLDFSHGLVEHASSHAGAIPHLEFVCADATHVQFEQQFEAIFSRFGVMFFTDPVITFQNLRRAMAPGARFCFLAWQSRAKNPWCSAPLETVLPLVPDPPPKPEPRAPGPFAFEDKRYFEQTLRSAGFSSVTIQSIEAPVPLGFGGVDAAVEFALSVGPCAGLTERQSPGVQTQIRSRLTELFAQHTQDPITLPGAAWLATGKR